MRIAFGCDHAGFPLKDALVDALQADGHDLLDLGTFSEEPVDYPDFARAVANAVQKKFVDLGVLVCGSGIGASIAANKFRGIRAALVHDDVTARQSRADDDANVLCLGAQVLDADKAVALTRTFLATPFSNDERHVRRVAKIIDLEGGILSRAERGKPGAAPARAPDAVPEGVRPAAAPAPAPALAPPRPAPAAPPEPRRAAEAPRAPSPPAEAPRPAARPAATTPVGAKVARPPEPPPRSRPERAPATPRSALEDAVRAAAAAVGEPEEPTDPEGVIALERGVASYGSQLGVPDLPVLDSTDPPAVTNPLARPQLPRTLFIVSSKSGTTAEVLAFYRFFRAQVEGGKPPTPGQSFSAI